MNPRIAALALAALGGASSLARATEYGTVLSSTPVLASVPVTQRECVAERAATPAREGSGVGALAGAVVGAAIGNAFGSGTGRALSTGIGMIAGAALGNHAEAEEVARSAPPAQRCRDVTRYEQRAIGYDVVYDYQGVQRSVRLAQPPGDRIALEVQVMPAGQVQAPDPAPMAAPVYRTPADNRVVDEAPRIVYAPPPPAVVYADPPVQASPWPYLVVGGITAVAIANAWGRGGHVHRAPRWHR